MKIENVSYEQFNEETKKYINTALTIYMAIKDKEIEKLLFGKRNLRYNPKYKLTQLDKKVLALLAAGFILDGKLKDTLLDSSNCKLNELFSYMGINKKQIEKIKIQDYEKCYEEELGLELLCFIQNEEQIINIHCITPTVIVNCLEQIKLGDDTSIILNRYQEEYDLDINKMFDALLNHNLVRGYMSKKVFTTQIGANRSIPRPNNTTPKPQIVQPKPNHQKSSSTSLAKVTDETWAKLDDIQKKFIGQEETAKGLFYNIIANQQLAQNDELPDGLRSIIFVDGPSGTGKTSITREITNQLDIPCVAKSITNYSAAGYVGGDITDILKELYEKANGDLEKAQRGIVVLDEIDKLACLGQNGLEMKKAVQHELLNLLGGGKYRIRITNDNSGISEIDFDTSKLTFICLGALTNLRTQKTNRKASIGFTQQPKEEQSQEYNITPQDLIDMGLEKELVGRFNTYLHTNDYSKESLIKILKESSISPLLGLRKLIESTGKTLEVEESAYEVIAEAAYQMNTGVRGLQSIVNSIRTHLLQEILRGEESTIHLNGEMIIAICEQTTTRKGRV